MTEEAIPTFNIGNPTFQMVEAANIDQIEFNELANQTSLFSQPTNDAPVFANSRIPYIEDEQLRNEMRVIDEGTNQMSLFKHPGDRIATILVDDDVQTNSGRSKYKFTGK